MGVWIDQPVPLPAVPYPWPTRVSLTRDNHYNRWKAARINALVAARCHEEQEDSESLISDDYSMCNMEEIIISEQRDYADDNTIAKELGIITEGIQHIRALNEEIRDLTNEVILRLTVEL